MVLALMPRHTKNSQDAHQCPLFVPYQHSSGAVSRLMCSICFWPVRSGTAQQQRPVDSGLLTTTGWHTEMQGDLTVVEDRQNCFQCTPKEALSKANIDFGEGLFDLFFFNLPAASRL